MKWEGILFLLERFANLDENEEERWEPFFSRQNWGFNDDVCPPTTSYAAYNVLTCPKEALITPINEHWTSEVTERGHLDWILEHLK